MTTMISFPTPIIGGEDLVTDSGVILPPKPPFPGKATLDLPLRSSAPTTVTRLLLGPGVGQFFVVQERKAFWLAAN